MPRSITSWLLLTLFSFVSLTTSAQVTARFTADDTAGCEPMLVHFTNTSTGATTYTWNLGNGSPPTSVTNASGSYVTAGTYTITLTAHNGSASNTYSSTIRVYPKPTVSFRASDTAVCPGRPISFTSTSTSGAWGSLSYTWNFGDGSSSSANSPSYAYPLPGFYSVTLFARNAPGCTNSATRSSYIHIFTPPSPGFYTPRTTFCAPPATIPFTNVSTGTGLLYVWRFGDGISSFGTSPVHTYTAPGSYTVTLKATDSHGCIDSMMLPDYIQAGALTADFTLASTACINNTTTFTNTSSTHIASTWNFDDGGTSTDETGVHTYTVAGSYNVRLIIFDGACFDTVIHPITIVPSPAITYTISPTHPCSPPVNLTYSASAPTGSTVKWFRNYGALDSLVGAASTFHITQAEIVPMQLKVTTAIGCVVTRNWIDTVYKMDIGIYQDPKQGCAPLPVNFEAHPYTSANDYTTGTLAVTGLAYPRPITGYYWTFGDGSPPSTSPTPSHTYTTAGVFPDSVILTDVYGCSRKAGDFPIRAGTRPIASFTRNFTHACGNQQLTFRSTSPPPVNEWTWNFGDNTYNTADSVVIHKFLRPGILRDSLTVLYNGCPSLVPAVSVDTIDSPVAALGYQFACIPSNQISYTNYSFGADTYLWQFGDGTSTSTVMNPIHTYTALANYNVMLTTFNSRTGCRDTARMKAKLQRLTGRISQSDSTICRTESVKITATVYISDTAMGSNDTTKPVRFQWYIDGALMDSTFFPAYGFDTFTRAYNTPGLHTVTLLVTDNHGCFDTFVRHVLVGQPTASFTYPTPTGCAPLIVNFTDHSTDVTGATIISHAWSFGDGILDTTTGTSARHGYTFGSTYTIKEVVTDDIGCADSVTSTSHFTIYRPTAGFFIGSPNVCVNAPLHFANTSSLATSYLWMFGDGSTTTVTAPNHTYTVAGFYTLRLVAYDTHGCTDTLTRPAYIHVNPIPVPTFTMSDSFSVCPPLNVNFTNTTVGASSYYWLLGDGSSSYATSPSDIYVAPGLYTVRLIATNLYGCRDTGTGHVNIFGYAGAFSYTPISGCSPLPVLFRATLSHVTSMVWDFSDGIISSSSLSDTITHRYTAPGAYLPKLILTDSVMGCTAFSLGADTIRVDTISSSFTASPAVACVGTPVSFRDTSAAMFTSIASRLWTFIAGATSTGTAPAYTFTVAGTYPVTLAVSNGHGCTVTTTQTVTITPLPSAITGTRSFCAGQSSTLSNTTSGGIWSSSNLSVATIGSSSGIVTGIIGGSAVITYTLASGCITMTTVTILPAPGAITGPTGVCVGSTMTLSDTTSGGTWTSSATGVAVVGLTTGIVSGISSGTAVISYSTGGTCIATKTVIANTIPLPISGSSPLCLGYTATYTDAITGGSWSSSNSAVANIGTSTGLVTGTGTGSAIITYMLGSACLTTKTVNIIPLPAAITGTSALCPGTTTTLSDATSGGSWSSSNTAIATIGSLSGIVTGISAGIDTITYSPAGCSVTRTVTVNPRPDSISGATRVCIGFSTSLASASAGGTWSTTGSAAIATVASATGIVSGISAGSIIVTYTLPTGCYTTTTVTVASTLPPITGAMHVCQGRTTLLSCAAGGGTWSSSDPSIASVSGGVVTGVTTGTVTISYIVSGCPVTATFTVNPLPELITGSTSVCFGLTTTLTDASPGGLWTSSNPLLATVGSVSGTVTGVAAGTVNITYTLPTGCITATPLTVLPAPPAITGVMHLCAGYTTTLSDPAIGGTWSSGATGIAIINPTTGVTAGLSAGTAIITYVYSGCPTMTTVTVNPLPDPIEGTTVACIGLTTMLTDSSAGGFWFSSDPTVATIGAGSGIVTAVSSGTATITYRLPTGCMASIPVRAHPLPPVIAGPSIICQGRTAIFTDSISGGTWSSSDTSVASIDITSGIAAGRSGGVAILRYTIDGCARITAVTVNRLPAPITGAATLCELTTITVHNADSAIGIWSSTLVTISAAGIVNGVSAGAGIITFTLPTGCYNTVTLTVLPTARPVSGSNSVCVGMSTPLADASPGGTWSSGSTAIATIGSTGIISGITPGLSSITYTLPNGCMRTKTVVVYPLPSAISGTANLCAGASSILTDTIPGGVWTSANPTIASITSATGTLSGLVGGTVSITYTLAPGCFATIPAVIAPLPAPYRVTGGGYYCAGSTGVSVGLSNSETGVNYTLYRGAVVVTTTSGTGSAIDFGPQSALGTYTVSATNASTACYNDMTGNVTIATTPTITPSVSISKDVADNICGGTHATFTAIPVNGGAAPVYQWSINGTIAGSDSINYSYYPANNDLVKVVMTSNAPCATPATVNSSITMAVTTPVTPAVAIEIAPDDTVCQGTPVTLNANTTYGGTTNTLTWMLNSSQVGTGSSYSYTPANGDIIYCTLISNYPCRTTDSVASPSITMTVDVPVVPDVVITAHPGSFIQEGQEDTLTAIAGNAGANPSYQWYINGAAVGGGNGGTLVRDNFADKDSVSCVVTGSDWCSTSGYNYIIINVGKTVDSNDDLVLFPNPNNGFFTIKGSLGVKVDEEVTLQLYDILGQEIFHTAIMAHKGRMNEQVQLNHTVANAIYILNLRSASKNRIFHITLVR